MENFWEKLSLVDLVPLGAVTTSLGTLDPLNYGHFMLIAVRHKNVYNTFQGGTTIIDQQTFLPNSSQVTGSIPMIHGSNHSLQNIGVGLLKDPALMGTFSLPPPSNLADVATLETYNMKSSISNGFGRFLNILSAWIIALIEIL